MYYLDRAGTQIKLKINKAQFQFRRRGDVYVNAKEINNSKSSRLERDLGNVNSSLFIIIFS